MNKTKKIAFLGLMLAIITVLSALEHMIPPLPLLPPNIKLGLSNIVTMYCVFFIGKAEASVLNVLKAIFVFLLRGPVAGALSFCGGMLSIVIIILIVILFKDKMSYLFISIAGAVTHNLGQIIAVSFILDSAFALYYTPILIISGIFMGIITGTLLKVIMPVFHKIFA